MTPLPPGGPTSPRRSRPEVPVFSFNAAPDPPVALSSTPIHAAAAPPADTSNNDNISGAGLRPTDPAVSTVRCPACESVNPADYRFCVTCGGVLKRLGTLNAERSEPPAKPNATAQPVVPARGGPAPQAARGDEKIVGAPVLDIASAGQAPAKFIICVRCHGSCVAGTRFCKYCGAPLDGRAAAPPPDPVLVDDHLPPDTRPTERRVQDAAQAALARNAAAAPGGSSGKAPPVPTRTATLSAGSPVGGSFSAGSPVGSPSHREDFLEALPSITELSEPGRRPEISQLAGSPIPAMPLPLAPPRSPFTPGSPPGGPAPAASPGGNPARRLDRKAGGRLVVIVEDGSEGRSFSLGDGQLDIGRVDGDIILEDDHYVSPRHARLRFVDNRWILRDLDSTNHVFVRLRRQHPLRDGDLLLLGLEVLQFQTVSDGERGLGHAMQHGTLLFGSPATPRRARLCQRTVEGVIRDVYHLFRDETVIGREMGDIVFTADPFLSRRHAAIRRSATTGEFTLADLDSSNGTYVAIRGEVGLSNGDYLRIGQHLFRVDLG